MPTTASHADPSDSSILAPSAPERGRVGLEVIAAFKFMKAITLVTAGLGTLGLLNPGWNEAALDWLEQLALDHGHRLAATLAERVLPYLGEASPGRLVAVALGAFLYAGVFLVEGVGLWRCKRWAEYLTILVTASLLPVELIALHRRLTPFRAGTLALNILVIGYLLWQLWVTRAAHRASAVRQPRHASPTGSETAAER